MSDNSSDDDGSTGGGEGKPTPPSKQPDNNSTPLLATLFALLIFAITLSVYFYLGRDTRPDVWAEATVPYDESSCDDGACETYGTMAAGHGGHGAEEGVEFVYNPAIDDAIAQWGDCRGEIMVCIQEQMLEAPSSGEEATRVSIINDCVAAADACPAECKTHFATNAAGEGFEGLEALYFATFEDERGYCVPREADEWEPSQ